MLICDCFEWACLSLLISLEIRVKAEVLAVAYRKGLHPPPHCWDPRHLLLSDLISHKPSHCLLHSSHTDFSALSQHTGPAAALKPLPSLLLPVAWNAFPFWYLQADSPPSSLYSVSSFCIRPTMTAFCSQPEALLFSSACLLLIRCVLCVLSVLFH